MRSKVPEDLIEEGTMLAKVLEKYKGIEKIVTGPYPDEAHFVLELLQNAEDASATEVGFFLNRQCLEFQHNGTTFSKEDLRSITNIGDGTWAILMYP